MFAIADAVLKSDAMSMRSKGLSKIPFLALFVLSACLPFVACGTPPGNVAPSLVPWTQKIQVAAASIGLGAQSKIVARTENLRPLADVLAGEISLVTGLQLAVKVGAAGAGDIFLSLEPSLKGEAHTFIVTDRATVQGGNYAAVALGTTTLLQSLQIRNGGVFLPMMSVEDAPQTEYRGLFVDVARQYHSLSNLRQMVQLCRLYKIRYLHLHFTDDQSFMFPSKAYPKLATQNQHGGKTYTIEELKELVTFADARGVTIIPELDVPGHSAAMNRAMRDLFMIKGTKPYEHHASINFAKAEVMQALETIVGEMCEVFKSSPYFHIGGDEADLAFANQNEDFKAAFAKFNLPNQHQLYRKFVGDMNDIVKKHGKQTMVWEGFGREADSPIQIPKDVIVMAYEMRFYQPDKLVKDGYRVINTSWTPLYVVNGGRSTEEIFAWQPRQFKPFGAKAEDKGVILPPEAPLFGAQMCAWEQSESVELPSLRRRLATMSERVWNPNAGRTYEEFSRQLESTDRVLDALVHQLTVRSEGTRIAGDQKFSSEVTLTVALAPGAKGTARYTLDGKDPTPASAACDAPIRIAEGLELRTGMLRGEPPVPFLIHAAGLEFEVDLLHGQKTGFYLDQIGSYPRVARHAAGRRVLDCFANQGAFALACAKAGAVSVSALEISADACAKIRGNATRNGLNIEVIERNVFDFLKLSDTASGADGARYDLIILDPPSFTKSRGKLDDALRGYKEIHLRALKLLAPDGLLATFCCSHHVSREHLLGVINEAAVDTRRTLRQLETFSQAIDHPIISTMPETEYLKGFLFELAPGR